MGELTRSATNKFSVNDKNFVSCEKQLIKSAGLKSNELKVFKVPVGNFEGKIVNLRTIICCSEENLKNSEVPKLVLVHGYCGSGALFHKIFKELSQELCLILVDLPGMGGSDHPNDFDKDNFTLEKCNSYFVDYLEQWRVQMNKSRTITELLGMNSQ